MQRAVYRWIPECGGAERKHGDVQALLNKVNGKVVVARCVDKSVCARFGVMGRSGERSSATKREIVEWRRRIVQRGKVKVTGRAIREALVRYERTKGRGKRKEE